MSLRAQSARVLRIFFKKNRKRKKNLKMNHVSARAEREGVEKININEKK